MSVSAALRAFCMITSLRSATFVTAAHDGSGGEGRDTHATEANGFHATTGCPLMLVNEILAFA